jgi:hypothetical protein
MSTRSNFVIILAFAAVGCRTPAGDGGGGSRVLDASTAATPACAEGDPTSFTITGQDVQPDQLKITFAPFPFLNYVGNPPDSTRQAQLDVCVVSDTVVTINRVRVLQEEVLYDVSKPVLVKNEGLAEALFGDLSKLNVIGKLDNTDHAGPDLFMIRGWKAGANAFVGFDVARLRDGTPVYYDLQVLAGNLVAGSATFPTNSSECASNETVENDEFQIDTAKFTMKSCTFDTADRSEAILPISGSLLDDNPEAGGTIAFDWTKAEAPAADPTNQAGSFNYHWSHHNMHDALEVITKDATYRMTFADFPIGLNLVTYEAAYLRTGKVVKKTLKCPAITACKVTPAAPALLPAAQPAR